jgi:hypothetical protein
MHLTKWLNLVKLVAPLVLSNVKGGDKIAEMIPTITDGIAEAEQIKGASGPEKKAHVLNVVHAGVAAANASGKVTLDQAEVQGIASDGIDAVVNTLHVIDGAKVVKPPPTPVPPTA